MSKDCLHINTKIWEPHLAGARKCIDCGMVYNPNRGYAGKNPWYHEPPSINDKLASARKTLLSCKAAMDYAYDDHNDQYYVNIKNLIDATLNYMELSDD